MRIWLNRNYATSVHLQRQLRDNPDGVAVEILSSHVDPSSPTLFDADEILPEPDALDPGFAGEVLAACRDHRVDVLLPVAGQAAIAERLADFAEAGVAVICPPAPAVRLLADKIRTYQELAGLDIVPPWRSVRSAAGFDAAYSDLSGRRAMVLKPAAGVGAQGVRFVTDAEPGLDELLGPVGALVSRATVRQALQAAEDAGRPIPELIAMPYLSGPEISVDVLAARGRVVCAVPRRKDGRWRVLDGPAELLEWTELLTGRFALDGLVNVQFRFRDGRPQLLEINTRPAGGMYQSELAGVNLVWAAVRQALGEPVTLPEPRLGARYVTVSQAWQPAHLVSTTSAARRR